MTKKNASKENKKKQKTHSEIYVSNEKCHLTEWLPEIDKDTVNIKSGSWFDIKYHERDDPIPVSDHKIKAPIISPESFEQQMTTIRRTKSTKKPVFLCTKKIRLYPNNEQIIILNQWFDAFSKMFNMTINYVRVNIFLNGKLKDLENVKKFLNFISIRNDLIDAKKFVRENVSLVKIIPAHILDEAIHQAVSNYKSCITNLINGNIKKFRVRPWSKNRDRKIIKIEANFFSNGTFCPRVFPFMDSSEPLTDITRTCTLQYDRSTSKYILLVPRDIKQELVIKEKISAGIDLGVRSFVTAYSQNNTYSICNDECQKYIEKQWKKIDKINELLQLDEKKQVVKVTRKIGDNYVTDEETRIINKQKLKKALQKYHRKIKNMVKDMHYKVAYELVNTFDFIFIGKLSTRNILSRNNKKLSKRTKRMLQALSPYAFRQILIYMGYKYGCIVREVSEYQSTITCSNCGRLNYIGKAKVHECKYCGMKADRDENSAKTHLKLGLMMMRKEAQQKRRQYEREKKKQMAVKKKAQKKRAGSKTNKKKVVKKK